MVPAVPGRIAIPVGLASLAAAQAVAASQVAVLEQLREKVDTGEPPEKKVALTAEEQQQLMQQALQHNLLAMASQFPMNIKVSNQGSALQPPAWPPQPLAPLGENGAARGGWGPSAPSGRSLLFLLMLILVFPSPR